MDFSSMWPRTLGPHFRAWRIKTVILSVNDKPSMEGARAKCSCKPSAARTWLRHYAWMEDNRQRVDKLSSGKIGYIYVRDTGQEGQNQLYRQFRAQYTKPGLIIDERWNAGGQIPDRFIELLARKVTNYWGVRDGHDWQTPAARASRPAGHARPTGGSGKRRRLFSRGSFERTSSARSSAHAPGVASSA